jgi:hypothetical protein
MTADWRSLHVFFSDLRHADPLALAAAACLREAAQDPNDWFFIRYAEGGAHLRVRLGPGAQGAFAELESRLEAECLRLAAEIPPAEASRAEGYPDGQGRLYPPEAVVEIDYVPETRRYGGPAALIENERLFRVSTALAIRAVALTLSKTAERARAALDLMLAGVAGLLCDQEDPGGFFAGYARHWSALLLGKDQAPSDAVIGKAETFRHRFEQYRAFLEGGAAAGSLGQHWAAAMRSARARFSALHDEGRLISPSSGLPTQGAAELAEALAALANSQLHMLNNRLGFSPAEEMVWSAALAEKLASD